MEKLLKFSEFILEKEYKDPHKKFDFVMKEFTDGKLHSNDGSIVKDQKQALAIAYSVSGLDKK